MANEYGIFQSIVEGDQADAYRRRKYDEKKEKERRDKSYSNTRGWNSDKLAVGKKYTDDNPKTERPWTPKGKEQKKEDWDRYEKAHKMAFDHVGKTKNYGALVGSDIERAEDAANRHLRRHPQKESGLCDFV